MIQTFPILNGIFFRKSYIIIKRRSCRISLSKQVLINELDIIEVDKNQKSVVRIDIVAPNDRNIREMEREKPEKYQKLKEEIKICSEGQSPSDNRSTATPHQKTSFNKSQEQFRRMHCQEQLRCQASISQTCDRGSRIKDDPYHTQEVRKILIHI